ncbi:putative phosphoribomutase [Neolecta irregularis DAH-3]|uniref:Putative phosphoribomutase n=1 Tax=Neolecta irregularis (strain DAH-3) TaxID=1198029 RepID=A0A1U7LL63_NEOID|nr:putative phosphoribomutase [Neolecta irregularis DAH-3]|eukprot:OLL23406.1 putative phosphoribomutase [Neolecta irregularis DAH-3]
MTILGRLLRTGSLGIRWNESTRTEIKSLLDSDAFGELSDRLLSRIGFGTAGLRGRMQAGFAHMNDLTVIQASQGLCAYILGKIPDAAEKGVVLGHDHRHNSEQFFLLSAAAFLHKGVKVHYYQDYIHTPLVPYAVTTLGAACGVMITASHNPAADNGYKVYWSNGCQILPPHDSGIASSILENLEPWTWGSCSIKNNHLARDCSDSVQESYFSSLQRLPLNRLCESYEKIKYVYTPMHGTGLPFAKRAFVEAGFEDGMILVEQQASPDPNFSTVKFPNPEESGALDLAMRTADSHNVDIVIANDPDADRFNAAEKHNGKWKIISGNQLGVLFGYYIFQKYKNTCSGSLKKLIMLSSAVSTRMLGKIAAAEGFCWEERLTGFKHLGNGALELQDQGYDCPFAFEEAIGYMIGDIVRDKDGVSAAVQFLEIVKVLKATGQTVCGQLEQLYEKYGYYESCNSYYICNDRRRMQDIFNSIRYQSIDRSHVSFPTHVGKRQILKVRDLTVGYDSSTPDNKPLLPVSSSSQMITFELEDDVVITIRGSGTEPKLKYYIEAKGESTDKARKTAEEVDKDIEKEWFSAETTGLRRDD